MHGCWLLADFESRGCVQRSEKALPFRTARSFSRCLRRSLLVRDIVSFLFQACDKA